MFQWSSVHSGKMKLPRQIIIPKEDLLNDRILLLLNTGKQIELQPLNLFIKDDNLYLQTDDDRIKFVERALIQISRYIDYDNDQYSLTVSGGRFLIASK